MSGGPVMLQPGAPPNPPLWVRPPGGFNDRTGRPLPANWDALMLQSPALKALVESKFGSEHVIHEFDPEDAAHPGHRGMPKAWVHLPADIQMMLATSLLDSLYVGIVDMLALTPAEMADPVMQRQVSLLEIALKQGGVTTGVELDRLRKEANFRDLWRSFGAGAASYSTGFGIGRAVSTGMAMAGSAIGSAAAVGCGIAAPITGFVVAGACVACCAAKQVAGAKLGAVYDPAPPPPPNRRDSYAKQMVEEAKAQWPFLSFTALYGAFDAITAYRMNPAIIANPYLRTGAQQLLGCGCGELAAATTVAGMHLNQHRRNDNAARAEGRPHAPVKWLDGVRNPDGTVDVDRLDHSLESLNTPRAKACMGWMGACADSYWTHGVKRLGQNVRELVADPAPAVGAVATVMASACLSAAANVLATNAAAAASSVATPTVSSAGSGTTATPLSAVTASVAAQPAGVPPVSSMITRAVGEVVLIVPPLGYMGRNVVSNMYRDAAGRPLAVIQQPQLTDGTDGIPMVPPPLTPAQRRHQWEQVMQLHEATYNQHPHIAVDPIAAVQYQPGFGQPYQGGVGMA